MHRISRKIEKPGLENRPEGGRLGSTDTGVKIGSWNLSGKATVAAATTPGTPESTATWKH